MMQKSTLFVLSFIVLLFNSVTINGQQPKHEMRAAWLASVFGLDWPKNKIPLTGSESDITQQKQLLINILDSVKAAGLNAVFFQVRPEADALYESSYEPWSEHLVAQRGLNPGYDPLLFAVEEAHKRGLELHAWINPYRFESTAGKYAGKEGDYRQTHPEWVLSYSSGGSILDPGNPEVRQLIVDIVKEIIVNYDVDGVIFDDYFYSYSGTPSTLDNYSQEKWKPASMDLGDWRRDNINRMIADVYHAIQQEKDWVRFGVSPFGIWTTDTQVAASYGLTLPSGITGLDAYKTIYADAVAWLRDGIVDYISPQLYWPTTSVGQDYKKLAPWWSDVSNKFGRHLYVSHSLSNLEPSDYPPPLAIKSASIDFLRTDMKGLSMLEYFSQLTSQNLKIAFDPSEVGLQIYWNRISDKNDAPGSVFFRASMINIQGFKNYLRSNEYSNLSLPPVIPWNNKQEVTLPGNLRIEGNLLKWDAPDTNIRYSIYAIPDILVNQAGIFRDASYLLGISYRNEFDLADWIHLTGDHVFAVSVLDRSSNEFPPMVMGVDIKENQAATLISPSDERNAYKGFSFMWSEISGAEFYILEVSTDSSFSSVIERRNVLTNSFDSGNLLLEEDSLYFWKIITRTANAPDTSSAIYSFRISPGIIYPADEMADVEVTPVIQWETFEETTKYRLQISTTTNFTNLVFSRDSIEGNSFELPPGVIFPYSTYYIKLEAVEQDSIILWSDIVKFSTVRIPPAIPEILSPTEGEILIGTEVTLTVKAELLAKSITFQLSNSETFPWNNRLQHSVQAPDYSLVLENLPEGRWFVKARSNYGTTLYTDWSDVVSFSMLATEAATIPGNDFDLYLPVFHAPDQMTIRYSLSGSSKVRFYITSLTGKSIGIVEQSNKDEGKHTFTYSIAKIPPGIYLLTLETDYGRKTVKITKPK